MANMERVPGGAEPDERYRLLERSTIPEKDGSSEEITAKFEGRLQKGRTYADMEVIELGSKIVQRESWSVVLLWLVGLIIVCDMVIIFFTGFGLMKFEKDYTLPLFIGSNLAQIFVLSMLVVKFLFKQEESERSRRRKYSTDYRRYR